MANKHSKVKSCGECGDEFRLDARSIGRMVENHGMIICKPCQKLRAKCRKCDDCLIEGKNWQASNFKTNRKICGPCVNETLRPKTEAEKERRREISRAYVANNSDKRKESVKRYYDKVMQEDPEKIREKNRRYKSSPRGKATHAANQAKRKKRIKQATPPWVDYPTILAFYIESERITRETGILHQVDHIHPIAGELISGLHVAENLQIITASANASKKNHWNP